MSDSSFDCIVIGAGPGGYVAAIRAAQLGLNTALIDKRNRLGGTCLNIGCIPSKALLDSSELFHTATHGFQVHGIAAENVSIDVPAMIARKDKVVDELTRGIAGLMKKNKVTVFNGRGELLGDSKVKVTAEDGSDQTISASKSILIATGSVPTELPFAKVDGKNILSSTEVLDMQAVPKHLVVIGGGYIGLELGSVWLRLGSKITVIEMLPELVPFMDRETAKALHKSLQKQGMTFMMGTKVKAVDGGENPSVTVIGPDDKEQKIECDKILVSIGRRPFTQGLGLEVAGVELDERGRIKVDKHYNTTAKGVAAVGDVIEGPMLAHKAEDEGTAWAENVAGKHGHVNYAVIPSVVYTWPEASSVGLTEEQAREKFGDDVKIGKFPFAANGRAKAMGEREGFVKVIAGPYDRVVGVHIFGPRASDMIAEAAAVMEFNGTAEDIYRTCHSHPTLSEALKEAALATDGRPIHF